MPAEYPTYRNHIEQLNLRFPDKDLLTRRDLMAHTGLCLKSIQNYFPFRGRYLSKVQFAKILAREDAAQESA